MPDPADMTLDEVLAELEKRMQPKLDALEAKITALQAELDKRAPAKRQFSIKRPVAAV
jgi:hypothetical protein